MGARDYAMSDFSPTLVLQTSIAKSPNDMANVQIKSEKLTPFGRIFPIMKQFDALLVQTIDSTISTIHANMTHNSLTLYYLLLFSLDSPQ